MKRFGELTAETRAILTDFSANGRKVKSRPGEKPVLRTDLLSPGYRLSAVYQLRRFLDEIGKNDVLAVTAEDADSFLARYASRGMRDHAVNVLADARAIYKNLYARGIISTDPLATITNKIIRIRNEFVMPDGLALLQNMSSVDFKSFEDVRDRLITFGSSYDFALRIGETARLKITDVSLTEYVDLLLRPEIQKGQNNHEVIFNSFFGETRQLMESYLAMRAALNPQTEALFVSCRGLALGDDGCTRAVKRQCKKLGVVSTKGKVPSPHIFRHAFAVNNIASLGLRLDPYMVMQRLRHKNIEVTIDVYLNNNPLIQRERHKAVVAQHNGNAHRSFTDGAVSGGPHHGEWMSELDAVSKVSDLGITWQGLRKFAEEKQALRRMGEAVFYSKPIIEDLAANWVSKKQVMSTLGFGDSRFYYWAKSRCVEPIQIGKICLVRAKDVMRSHQ